MTPGSRELAGDGAVQEGGAAARRDAADHAGQPHHHDRRGPQGLGRPVRAAGRRLPGAVDRHQERDHADRRQQRRHRGDRRHLRGDDHATTSTRCRSSATSRSSATCSSTTGNASEKTELLIFLTPRVVKDTVTVRCRCSAPRTAPAARVARQPIPTTMPRCRCTGAISFWSGLPGAGKSTLGRQLARRLGKRFVDADIELEQRLGVSIPTIFEIEGEAGFRDREEAVHRRADALDGHRARDRRRRGAARRPTASGCATNGTVVYLHAEPPTLWRARAAQPPPAAAATRRPARAPRRALRAARPAVPRDRRPSSSSPSATRGDALRPLAGARSRRRAGRVSRRHDARSRSRSASAATRSTSARARSRAPASCCAARCVAPRASSSPTRRSRAHWLAPLRDSLAARRHRAPRRS